MADLLDQLDRLWEGAADSLEARRGFIRHGHGDLQSDNVFVESDTPRFFDCIEFNDQIATGDTALDVAWLAFDVERICGTSASSDLVNEYVRQSSDEEGFEAVLPLYKLLRCAVTVAHWGSLQGISADRAPAWESKAAEMIPFAMDLAERCVRRLAGEVKTSRPPGRTK